MQFTDFRIGRPYPNRVGVSHARTHGTQTNGSRIGPFKFAQTCFIHLLLSSFVEAVALPRIRNKIKLERIEIFTAENRNAKDPAILCLTTELKIIWIPGKEDSKRKRTYDTYQPTFLLLLALAQSATASHCAGHTIYSFVLHNRFSYTHRNPSECCCSRTRRRRRRLRRWRSEPPSRRKCRSLQYPYARFTHTWT